MPIAPAHRKATILGILTIGILGISTFALAMKTFPARLRAPFRLLPAGTVSGALSPEQDLLTSTKDTDRDGVPDVQELKVYKTSPFLEDTDSDGKSDGAEIAVGEDPNCPAGQDCRIVQGVLPDSRELERTRVLQSILSASAIEKITQAGIPGLTDAATLRQVLKQAGVSEEILAQFSDEELVKLAQENLQKSPSPRPSPTGGEGVKGQIPQNLTPAQIREILLTRGFDPKLLEKVSDEQLTKLYQETVKEVK